MLQTLLKRAKLWDWITNNLPHVDWIIGGDFNMVEHHNDRSWISDIKLNKEEFDKWLLCHNTLGVFYPIHKKRGIHDSNWFT